MLEYQMALQQYQQNVKLLQEVLTNISNTRHEMAKGIANNLRG